MFNTEEKPKKVVIVEEEDKFYLYDELDSLIDVEKDIVSIDEAREIAISKGYTSADILIRISK